MKQPLIALVARLVALMSAALLATMLGCGGAPDESGTLSGCPTHTIEVGEKIILSFSVPQDIDSIAWNIVNQPLNANSGDGVFETGASDVDAIEDETSVTFRATGPGEVLISVSGKAVDVGTTPASDPVSFDFNGDCTFTIVAEDTGCAEFFEPCTTDADCCGGLPCLDGKCI